MANLSKAIDHLRGSRLSPILLVDGLEKQRGDKLKKAARLVAEFGRLNCSVVLWASGSRSRR